MGKKTFKDNPAMQFITPPEEEADAQEETPEELQEEKPKAKRPKAAQKPPAGYKLDPNMVETKTKRVQLVLQPSLYERAKEKAWRGHLSVNEYIHQLIEKDTGSGEL